MPHSHHGLRPRRTLLGGLTSVLLAASCAHMRPATESGFLSSGYDALKPAPERQVWGVPDEINLHLTDELTRRIASSEIRDVYVEPAVYMPVENARYRPTPAAARRLEGYATRKFRNALRSDFHVIDEPCPGSVTVRLALTDMMNSNVWTNSFMTALLVPVDQGAVSGEMEIVDSATGEPLLAMTATRGGAFFLFIEAFNRHGHVRHGIKKWARLTSKLLRGR